MPTLTLIRGLPGSGKSTLAKRLLTDNDKHFEADMYFVNSRGEYTFDPELLVDAHTWCQSSTNNALNTGYNVIVSNTFTTKREMQPYLDMAKDYDDVKVNIILMQGQFGSIHNIPQHTMVRMQERFEYTI